MEDVVIVGSGPAGLTAALYAARADMRPLVVEGMQPGGQLTTTTEIENFPGFPQGIDGNELVARMRGQAERFGARCVTGEVTAAGLGDRPFRLTLSDGRVLETRTIVIATGASAIYLDIPSVRALIGRGVTACATCDGAFYRGVPVAVVGGGDSACEESLFLTRFASRVYMLHRRDRLRASKIMGDRVEAHPKIEVVWDTVVEEAMAGGNRLLAGVRVRNVRTGATRELAVEGLFMGIGHTPNVGAFAGQVETDAKGFIAARHTCTSVPGVFAAGDVQDPTYKQAVTAAGSGCMAALEVQRYLESQAG